MNTELELEGRENEKANAIELWYQRFRWCLCIGLLLCLFPLLKFTLELPTDNAIEKWLDANDPVVQRYDTFRKTFGTSESLILAFDRCPANDPRLEDLASQLDQLVLVRKCTTPQRALKESQTFASAQGAGSSSQQLSSSQAVAAPINPLVARKTDFCGVVVELRSDVEYDRQELLDKIRQISNEAGFNEDDTHLAGSPVVNVALDQGAKQALMQWMPLVGFVALVLLYLSIRRLWIVCWLVVSSVMSVIAMLGLMSFSGASMNLIATALPPMILVLSLSFGLHIVHVWRNAPENSTAIGYTVLHTIKPSFLAALTTAIGSASLMMSDFEPVRVFGLWGAVGVMASFVITFLWLPSMLQEEKRTPGTHSSRWPAQMIQRLPFKPILALWPVLILVGIAGMTQMKGDADGLAMLADESETIADYARIERRLTGMLPVEIIVRTPKTVSLVERAAIVRAVSSVIKSDPDVESVSEPFCIHVIGNGESNYIESGQLGDRVAEDGTSWRLTANIDSREGGQLSNIVKRLKGEVSSVANVEFTGLVPLIIASQEEIFESLRVSLLTACGILGVVLLLGLRSFSGSVVVLLLNVTPIIIVFGALGWFGHSINLATLTTASIALGVALDDTLHFIEHFRSASRKLSESSDQSMQSRNKTVVALAAQCSFRPMVQTTMIAGLSLAILSASSFKPIAEFGGLLALLVAVALVLDLTLLPSVLSTKFGTAFLDNT